MVSEDDSRHSLELKNSYIIVPNSHFSNPELLKKFMGKRKGKLPDGFTYDSNTNTEWLSTSEFQELLKHVP